MFAAEKEARASRVVQEKPSTSLLAGFVKHGGGSDQAAEALEKLLDDGSPLLEDMCSVSGESEDAVKRNRGMVLRLQGSMEWRIFRRTRRKTSYFEMVRTLDENTQESKDRFSNVFMSSSLKDCCLEPYFELRSRNEFKKLEGGARAALSEGAPYSQAVTWAASSAPLFVISGRETDHASLSNKLAATRVWNQGLFVPAQVQMCEKWQQILPLHVAKQRGVFDQPGEQRKMLNQFSAPDSKVSHIFKLADKAMQDMDRSRVCSHRAAAGLFLTWRGAEIRRRKLADPRTWSAEKAVAISNELIEKWSCMPPSQKTAAKIWQIAQAASASARASAASLVPASCFF